jgi:hypothetical protein
MKRTLLATVVSGLVLVSACAGTSTEPPTGVPKFSLLQVSSDGAIALDATTGAFLGFDRTGTRAWADETALDLGADVRCLAACPDAVLSGTPGVEGVEPWQFTGGLRSAVTVPADRVLTARTASDAVVVDGGALRVIRPDGSAEAVPVAGDVVWFENPDRTSAVAFGLGSQNLLRFGHDANGWHLVDDRMRLGRAWGACVVGVGQMVALVGEEPVLVVDGERRPIRTDLESAGECAFGTASGVVVQRTVDQDQRRRTSVRGVDLAGRQTWSRDLDGEAAVAASPSGRLFALAHGGVLELVDATGKTVSIRDGVDTGLFTASGELVTVSSSGQVRWSDPG